MQLYIELLYLLAINVVAPQLPRNTRLSAPCYEIWILGDDCRSYRSKIDKCFSPNVQ
jgi:hypothetical protein